MIRPFDLIIRDRRLSMLLDIQPGRYYSDTALTYYLDSNQVPEPELIHVLFRALKPGNLAIDAGACVGFFTIIMSRLVGPTGKVIAIEPDSRNLAMLRKNLDINDCSNVEIIEQPLTATEESVPFFENVENGQSSLHLKEAEAVTRHRLSTTLARVIGAGRPTLLKMDIEGSETEALHGMSEFDEFIPYIVSEVNPHALDRADSSVEELVETLDEWGYSPFVLHADGSLPSLVQEAQSLKITRPNTNMLFTQRKQIVALWPEVDA